MNAETRLFIARHRLEDVGQLALRGCRNAEVDLTLALQQIAGWQTARTKLPSWAERDDMLYPPRLNLEQCSSEQTARYKAAVCRRLVGGLPDTSLIDLTGGFGADFTLMSQVFGHATYVERDSQLFAISSHNMALFGKKVENFNADGIDFFLSHDQHYTMVFADPARRDDHGRRTYGIADCTPNVLEIEDVLLQRADYVMLKLSPMLDWRKAMADLGESHVSEIHIVAVHNECKELLVVLQQQAPRTTLHCINDDQTFTTEVNSTLNPQPSSLNPPPSTLLLPNAAVMKAGCFSEVAQAYGVEPLAPNSHLFTARGAVDGFPGTRYRIVAVTSMNKQQLKTALAGIGSANISVRNFPLSAVALRQRLKLADGGAHHIFGTTDANGRHILIVAQKC